MVLKYGDRVDIFALGKTIRKILTPGMASSTDVQTKNFLTIVKDMETPNPQQRPTAKQVLDRISKLQNKQSQTAQKKPPKKRVRAATSRNQDKPTKKRARVCTTPAAQPTTPQLKQSQTAEQTPTINQATTTTSRNQDQPKERARVCTIPAAQPTTPHQLKQSQTTEKKQPTKPVRATTPRNQKQPKERVHACITPAAKYEQKISEAAKRILSCKKTSKGRGAYKKVCMELGLNLNKNGDYLKSEGADYKRIQTTIRKMTRQSTNKILSAAMTIMDQTQTSTRIYKVKRLTERIAQAEKQMEIAQQHAQAVEQRAKTAERQRDEMIKQMETAQQRAQEAKQRAKTAERQRDEMTKQMETAQPRSQEAEQCAITVEKQHPIPLGSPIFVVHEEWIDMYRKGCKCLEIRSRSCNKPRGSKIYLSGTTSGGVGLILASVIFQGSRKISSNKHWEDLRPLHRNPHKNRRYGDRTHAWIFTNFESFETPIPYHVKKGIRQWRNYTPVPQNVDKNN